MLFPAPDLLEEAIPHQEKNGYRDGQHCNSPTESISDVEALRTCKVGCCHIAATLRISGPGNFLRRPAAYRGTLQLLCYLTEC